MTGKLLRPAGCGNRPPFLTARSGIPKTEDKDSRHYLNGFVGKGKKCEYLNPSTDEWAKKHIAAQKRLEAKSSKRRSSKSAASSSRGPKRKSAGAGEAGLTKL